jgi:hypothetical protein
VIGVLARLDVNKSETKKASNCEQFLVYLGSETYEEYKEEMADIIPVLNKLLSKELTIKVGNKEYTIDPYLVVDMKSLCTMLGLYNVYHPKTKFCCCWCGILRSLIVSPDAYEKQPLRNIEAMKVVGNQAKNRSSNSYASNHEGIKVTCLYNIEVLTDRIRLHPCSTSHFIGLSHAP